MGLLLHSIAIQADSGRSTTSGYRMSLPPNHLRDIQYHRFKRVLAPSSACSLGSPHAAPLSAQHVAMKRAPAQARSCRASRRRAEAAHFEQGWLPGKAEIVMIVAALSRPCSSHPERPAPLTDLPVGTCSASPPHAKTPVLHNIQGGAERALGLDARAGWWQHMR